MFQPEHEKLEVYQRALRTIEPIERVARGLPYEHRDLAEQLRRAAASVVLNIAEGANEFSPGDKAKFYRIARRSAGETLAALDVATRASGVESPRAAAEELRIVTAMLTKMVFALMRRR